MSAKRMGRFAGLAFALAAVAAILASPSAGSDASAAVFGTLDFIWN